MHITNGRRRSAAVLGTWALCMGLAACQSPPADRPLTSEVPEPPSFVTPPDTCQAASVRFGLGLRITQQLLEEMRQRACARIARTVRATEASDPAQDMMRLNVQFYPNVRVVCSYCG